MVYSKYFDTHEVCLNDDDCRAIRSLLSIGGAGAKVGRGTAELAGGRSERHEKPLEPFAN